MYVYLHMCTGSELYFKMVQHFTSSYQSKLVGEYSCMRYTFDTLYKG